MTQNLRLGEIWLANLNPNKGKEPGKTRPVLIVQDQVLLDIFHPTTLVIPLTTNLVENAYPLRIRIKAQDNLDKESDLLIDQMRAIDNKRLISGPLTFIEKKQLKLIYEAINEVIGNQVSQFFSWQ